MAKIKICGITDVETALAAAGAGADMLGLVFAPSRRRVPAQQAQRISRAVRKSRNAPELVGVFVNSPPEEVNRLSRLCLLDRVQLSGDETWDYCGHIESPIIKTVHIGPGISAEQGLEMIKAGYNFRLEQDLVCLLDTRDAAAWGGTGRCFDWKLAAEICGAFPVMVAGGLSPDNVGRLLAEASPWGVDVSSGVETDGAKDISKIKAFIAAVKLAERKRE